MSVSIEVASITRIPAEKPAPPAYYRFLEERLEKIKAYFGWKEVPWQEPSAVRGLETSFSVGRFALLEQIIRTARATKLDFPQLLVPESYNNYYIPISFRTPIRLTEMKDEMLPVGSSLELLVELEQASEILDQKIKIYGKDTKLTSQFTWEDIKDFCDTLLMAAHDSKELNLPIYMCY